MADNPILDQSFVPVYERDREPRSGTAEAIQKTAGAVSDIIAGVEYSRFEQDLTNAENQGLADQEQKLSEIDDVVSQVTNEDPQFAEAVRQITRFQLMKDQGIGDDTAINIQREHVLRAWTARHPEWASDLLKAVNARTQGSTLGEAIAAAKGPAKQLDDIETNARQLGVDMSLRYSDPVAFATAYVKATKANSQLQDAQRAWQLLQTTQQTEKGLAERGIQQIFDNTMGAILNPRIAQFEDSLLAMADTPSTVGEAETLNAIRAAARKELSDGIAFVMESSHGTLSREDAIARVPQLQRLQYIVDAADPQEALTVAQGAKAYREAELEGWYKAHPGTAVKAEQLRLFSQLGAAFPGLVQQQNLTTEVGRLAGYFLNMDGTVDTNDTTGVAIPRTDSLGITQDSTNAAKSTYAATSFSIAHAEEAPEYTDRHMLNLADEWESGNRPAKRTLDLARQYMATDGYKNLVASSGLSTALRQERAAKIANMLVGEMADDFVGTTDGQPLMWTRSFGGMKWSGDRVELVQGSGSVNLAAANDGLSPYLTQMVKAVAHASGLSYEQAADRVWRLLQETM